jgi:hypothetical protein
VINLPTNLGWCTGTLDVPGWDREMGRFVMNLGKRKTNRYVGTTAGVSGERIGDLVAWAVGAQVDAPTALSPFE